MNLITSPTESANFERPAIFLGGGITGAPDWQPRATELLTGTFATCFNPRRADGFTPPGHPDYLQHYKAQVRWEHDYLLNSDVVLFWLPKEALCITTRFEVGWWFGLNFSSRSNNLARPFALGIEPGVSGETYYRVVLPEVGVPVHNTLEETCEWACKLIQNKK